ncbi:MAG: DUF898 domain-containing protein [Saprospiraceae bacterium]|nr:DUF898 domain-containing protein [Saprospiraceae bacterium]
MENFNNGPQEYQLRFYGKGSEYFGIIIVNWLLTAVTLGLYYPWAKANQLRYLYSVTVLNDDAFIFEGTGKEMFKGFIRVFLYFVALMAFFLLFLYLNLSLIGAIILYGGIFAIMPLAIHGSYRYRMSRTSWRGIRFGYRGDRSELVQLFIKGILLTIVTIGIYGSWFVVDLRNYVMSHVRFGNIRFKSNANGFDYFMLNLKGFFLTMITLGIYVFWWQKDIINFYLDHLSFHKGDQEVRASSTVSGGSIFALTIVNMLILMFTFGLGYAWVVMRTMSYVIDNLYLDGDIELDTISQTEDNYTDATGEDASDYLDMDFII